MMIRIGSRQLKLPPSRLARMAVGCALVIGGFLGFLPVLGFWMVPLGLLVLSADLPAVRVWRRRMIVRVGRWLKRHYPALWRRMRTL